MDTPIGLRPLDPDSDVPWHQPLGTRPGTSKTIPRQPACDLHRTPPKISRDGRHNAVMSRCVRAAPKAPPVITGRYQRGPDASTRPICAQGWGHRQVAHACPPAICAGVRGVWCIPVKSETASLVRAGIARPGSPHPRPPNPAIGLKCWLRGHLPGGHWVATGRWSRPSPSRLETVRSSATRNESLAEPLRSEAVAEIIRIHGGNVSRDPYRRPDPGVTGPALGPPKRRHPSTNGDPPPRCGLLQSLLLGLGLGPFALGLPQRHQVL